MLYIVDKYISPIAIVISSILLMGVNFFRTIINFNSDEGFTIAVNVVVSMGFLFISMHGIFFKIELSSGSVKTNYYLFKKLTPLIFYFLIPFWLTGLVAYYLIAGVFSINMIMFYLLFLLSMLSFRIRLSALEDRQ
ncbi:hypothetical protein FKB34_12315 [Glycocaulis profundi]|nr:hypothetical protein FKB34_12315 [Glycocaulis profundi]